MCEECICIEDYEVFKEGKKYKCEIGRFMYKIFDDNDKGAVQTSLSH